MVVEFSSRKKWGNVGQLCGKVGKCLTIRNLFRHSRRSTCAEAQMPEATMPRHSGVQTNDRSKVQSNVCLNIRSNARLNNQSNNQSNVRLSIRSNACLSNQSNNQSNVYLSIRSNNHLNKHSNAPSVNKPIHGKRGSQTRTRLSSRANQCTLCAQYSPTNSSTEVWTTL